MKARYETGQFNLSFIDGSSKTLKPNLEAEFFFGQLIRVGNRFDQVITVSIKEDAIISTGSIYEVVYTPSTGNAMVGERVVGESTFTIAATEDGIIFNIRKVNDL